MEEVATMPSNAQEFCLRWNNFHSSLVSALDGFKNDLDFVDVTLACEGQFLKAHKMLLSACSVFFRDLLKANPCQHPIVILPPEVRFIDLEKMLRFIYQGEVNVHQENLARFLKTAEMLKIRGLAEDNEKSSSPRPPEGTGNNQQSDRGNDNTSSVSPKRPRLSIDTQSGSEHPPPHTPNDENSRLSGPDSDSEMIPVKQEMIELKECDFETADGESFLAENYLRETTTAAASSNNINNNNNNNNNTTQPPQTHPAAPPPPGPLLPSYVPPPQVKAQDDSPLTSNQDDISQGSLARLAPVSSAPQGVVGERGGGGGGEGEVGKGAGGGAFVGGGGKEDDRDGDPPPSHSGWTPGQTPKSTRRVAATSCTSSNRFVFAAPRGVSSPVSAASSPASTASLSPSPSSPSPSSVKKRSSPGHRERVSPRNHQQGNFSSPAATGTSLSIWHPPPSSSSPLTKEESNGGIEVNAATFPLLSAVASASGGVVGTGSPGVGGGVSGSLTCDICLKTFTSRSNLNKHKRVQHSGEEYACPICKRTFKNRYYIKDHVNLCSASAASSTNASTHKKPSPVAAATTSGSPSEGGGSHAHHSHHRHYNNNNNNNNTNNNNNGSNKSGIGSGGIKLEMRTDNGLDESQNSQ